MPKNKSNQKLKYLLLIAVLLVAAFLIFQLPFFSSEKDILFLENTCRDLQFQNWDKISPKIVNPGTTPAYVKTCLSSEQFIFENYKHEFCLEEQKILPLNNSIQQEISINTDPEADDAKKASINVKISCKKHFLFFRKSCGVINYSCNFDKVSALDLMG